MTKAESVSHVAAETSTTGAVAERMVGAVFYAIADALVRDEPVATAGFGKLTIRGRAARVRDTIPETRSRSPYRCRRCRRPGRRQPFATRSTISMMGHAVTCSPSVFATRPLHVRAFETQTCKTSFLASHRLPTPFPPRAIARQSIHTRLVTERMWQKGDGEISAIRRTFRTRAQSRAEIVSPAGGILIQPRANFLRQCYAPLLSSRSERTRSLPVYGAGQLKPQHNRAPVITREYQPHEPAVPTATTQNPACASAPMTPLGRA